MGNPKIEILTISNMSINPRKKTQHMKKCGLKIRVLVESAPGLGKQNSDDPPEGGDGKGLKFKSLPSPMSATFVAKIFPEGKLQCINYKQSSSNYDATL